VSERSRRLVHLSGTAIPGAFVAGVVDWSTLRVGLLVAAGAVAALEAARLSGGLDLQVVRSLTRTYERGNVAGYALFTWSVTLVAWLFAPPVAVPGMVMLSVGDPVAGVLGRRLGDDRGPVAGAEESTSPRDEPDGADAPAGGGHATDDVDADADADVDPDPDTPDLASRTKPPAVLAATFLVCLALGWPFTTRHAGPVVGGAAAAVGAIGATLADGVKPVIAGRVVDDNLSIAPAACTGIWIVFRVAGV
jgi:dolichol kinase